jgi:hypothetical protein
MSPNAATYLFWYFGYPTPLATDGVLLT